jgi:hypothetical protein
MAMEIKSGNGITTTIEKKTKPLNIVVRPFQRTDKSSTIAWQILDNRLLKVVHAAIENLHALLKHNDNPSKIKAADMQMEKAFHRVIMNQKLLGKRLHIFERTNTTIDTMLNLFPQKPLFLQQKGLREMYFQPCLPTDPDPEDLLETNLPFVLPASISLHNLLEFIGLNREWMWTFKLDGIRLYMAFLTIGEQKLALWVNRKGKVWLLENVELGVPDDMYDGSVYDGELTLLQNGNTIAYTIHDCLSMCGKIIGHRPKVYRLNVAYHSMEKWNQLSPPNCPVTIPFFRGAYMIERWVRPDFVIRIKQFYSVRDVAYLLDRVMPYVGQRMDGLIGETAEDSMFVKPKKFKLIQPIDLTARFFSENENEGIYSVWAYDGLRKRYVEWTDHGFLSISRSQLLSNWKFYDPSPFGNSPHEKVVEVDVVEKDDFKSLKFKTYRHQEKKYPNDIRIVRETIKNQRQAIRLDELFPPELFKQRYKCPEAARVIEMRARLQLNWDQPSPTADLIPLPAPIYYAPSSSKDLQSAWKTKCSPYSIENAIYMQSRVS